MKRHCMHNLLLGTTTGLTALATVATASPLTLAEETQSEPRAEASTDAKVASVVTGNSAFALDLYQQLREGENGNIFCSPYSISTALGMTWAGARTETERRMAETLHVALDQEALHPAFHDLAAQLEEAATADALELAIANRLWGQDGEPFRADFLDLIRQSYAGGFESLSFATDAERARTTINDWVEQQTRERITDLLQPGDVDASTTLVLTNAIYFKGDWATQFDPDDTRDGDFLLAAGKSVTASFMHQTESFGYVENDDLQLLEMPYDGERLSMIILLPRQRDGLAALEKKLTPGQLETWLAEARRRKVNVALPRFEMTSRFSLKNTLSKMGMAIVFSDRADFTGMSSSGGIFLDDVIHKAWVKVNEEGTEAAAATAVVGMKSSIEMNPVFRADHPFVFMIRDRETGSIVFLGRVVDPTA